MIDSELRRYVDRMIDLKLNIILHGEAGDTATGTETINNLYPGQPGITARPVMHPYGFVSRAVQGTISVIGRVGEHIGNRMTLGHRDKNRPSCDEGESIVYSKGKYQIRVLNGKIEIGKDGSFQPLMVGDDTMIFYSALIDLIVAHTHIGNLGAPTMPPSNAGSFTSLKSSTVTNGKLLVKDGGKF